MVRFGRAISLCALASTTAGCAAPYYWQAIGGQLELLRKREPIEEVIADPAVDPKLKTTLTRIATMRRFAVDELGLPSNDSYTTYVALDRPYVVWNVVATDEFSVDPQRWCFPFAGCVAYRGYFDKAAADRFAAKLAADGLDVQSGGSTAYSTLGYFDDPVLSTMVNGGEQYVASLLFHELAHQQLYVKATASSAKRSRWSSRSSARSAGCRSTEPRRISSVIARGAQRRAQFGDAHRGAASAVACRLRERRGARSSCGRRRQRAFDDAARASTRR